MYKSCTSSLSPFVCLWCHVLFLYRMCLCHVSHCKCQRCNEDVILLWWPLWLCISLGTLFLSFLFIYSTLVFRERERWHASRTLCPLFWWHSPSLMIGERHHVMMMMSNDAFFSLPSSFALFVFPLSDIDMILCDDERGWFDSFSLSYPRVIFRLVFVSSFDVSRHWSPSFMSVLPRLSVL